MDFSAASALQTVRCTPDNNSLKDDRILSRLARTSPPVLCMSFGREAAGGSRDLATIVGTVIETARADPAP